MNKVALVIIYNHQYNKNIDILEGIYKDRFSHIYHLVPFYNGEKQNVISVYESSFYFQGYIAQGLKSYFRKEYTHYFFVADDLVLNPMINERNYSECLELNSTTCFIPGFVTLHNKIPDSVTGHNKEKWERWERIPEAFYWKIDLQGVEAKNQLPNYDNALQKFQQHGLTIKPLRFNQIWATPTSLRDIVRLFFRDRRFFLRYLKNKLTKEKYRLSYPIVGSYSDICIVSSDTIQQFCHYCGVFAATKLHVELAIPTSLALSAQKIVTENDLKLQGKALWTEEQYKELDKYDNSLKKLLIEFPKSYLYLHPIKLSKWKTEL